MSHSECTGGLTSAVAKENHSKKGEGHIFVNLCSYWQYLGTKLFVFVITSIGTPSIYPDSLMYELCNLQTVVEYRRNRSVQRWWCRDVTWGQEFCLAPWKVPRETGSCWNSNKPVMWFWFHSSLVCHLHTMLRNNPESVCSVILNTIIQHICLNLGLVSLSTISKKWLLLPKISIQHLLWVCFWGFFCDVLICFVMLTFATQGVRNYYYWHFQMKKLRHREVK